MLGHRGPQEDGWRWTEPPRHIRPGGGWPLRWALPAAALLAVLLALLFALRPDNGESPPEAVPTPAPAAGPRARLAVWSDRLGEWRFGDLGREGSSYREGQAVPFLLRIQGTQPGETYRLALRYRCRGGGAAGFDFLTAYEGEGGTAPALAPGGPGRARPDSAIPMPDDPSIELDGGGRLFSLWGGTFQEGPRGPEPEGPCRDEKRIVLEVRAVGESLVLLWGAHLASAADWGEGAASADVPLSMAVEVEGARDGVAEVALLPGAVGR